MSIKIIKHEIDLSPLPESDIDRVDLTAWYTQQIVRLVGMPPIFFRAKAGYIDAHCSTPAPSAESQVSYWPEEDDDAQ